MIAPADVLAGLLHLVRQAAREGAAEALAARRAETPATSALVTKGELAAMLGTSPATIDRLTRRGAIPFVVVGACRRFDPAAVRAALESVERAAPVVNGTTAAPVRLLRRGAR